MTIVADHLKVKIFQVRTPTKNWSSGKKTKQKTNKQINKIKKHSKKATTDILEGKQFQLSISLGVFARIVHLSNGPLFSA